MRTQQALLPFVLVVLFFALTAHTARAAQNGSFTYEDNGPGITITGYTGTGGAVAIPDTIAGKPVTIIGSLAFIRCVGLRIVTIPDTVITIGGAAFQSCTGLTNLTIGKGVTSIGNSAFFGCTSLPAVNIPKSVTAIDYAFGGCDSLTNILVDPLNPVYSSVDGVLFDKNQTVLVGYAGGKTGSYTIPATVTAIGAAAFSSSPGLSGVSIPESVTEIRFAAFSQCTGLASVTIPDSVTSIGGSAFFQSGLATINIPNSVTAIGDYAFADCNALTNLTFPSSVTNIGFNAFTGCPKLVSIAVDSLNPAYSSVDGVLFNQNQSTLVEFPEGKIGSYAIPEGVSEIAGYAFGACVGLTAVTVPDTVTSIGFGAFADCPGLKSVYFIGNAPDLGEASFQDAYRATVFYRAGATGWDSTFGDRPALLWIPTDDLDDDGLNNQEEMLAGTDPVDASSLLAFESTPRPDALADTDRTDVPAGQHALYFQSIPGLRYEILSSETLGGPWTTAATVSATTSQKRALVDNPAGAAFYRIHILP